MLIIMDEIYHLCFANDLQGVIEYFNSDKHLDFDLSVNNYEILKMLCRKGHCKILIYLYERKKFDTLYDHDIYFRLSAHSQSIELLDFLYKFSPNIRFFDDIIFEVACKTNKSKTIRWLLDKCLDYQILDHNNKKYYIKSESEVYFLNIMI